MPNYADILLQDIARHFRQSIYLFYSPFVGMISSP